MAKSQKSSGRAGGHGASRDYKPMGEAGDGTVILEPVTRPKSFSVTKLRKVIREVQRDERARAKD